MKEINSMRSSTVRIFCLGKRFDWMSPFNVYDQHPRSSGTGFVLEELQRHPDREIIICTAYHVVEMSEQILIQLSDVHYVGQEIKGETIAFSQNLDVAILRVEIPLPSWMVPMQASTKKGLTSDDLKTETQVQAVGFPLSQGFTMTAGNISGRTESRLQISAAVNFGNSGGPLISKKDNVVVGVVVSGLDNAQNINFATPLEEIRMTLFRVYFETPPASLKGISMPNLSFNFEYSPKSPLIVESPYYKGLKEGETGVYVTFCHPDSQLFRAGLREGDIVCSLDGFSIDQYGKIQVKWWEFDSLLMESILSRKRIGESMEIRFWSLENQKLLKRNVQTEKDLNMFRIFNPESEKIHFCMEGGIVVQPFSLSLGLYSKKLLSHYGYLFKNPQMRAFSVPIVTSIMNSSPFKQNMSNDLNAGDVIVKVNQNSVSTFEEFEENFNEALQTSSVVVLTTFSGNVSVALSEKILDMKQKMKELKQKVDETFNPSKFLKNL